MRLNKRLQYGLLLVLYLCRSGRTSAASAAEGLLVSRPFLEQVARSLRIAGVIKSVRGPGGGYELAGDPTVLEVFNAISPVSFLSKKEAATYAKGPHEHRAFAQFVNNLVLGLAPLLRRKVRNIGNELVASEMARLARAPASLQVN